MMRTTTRAASAALATCMVPASTSCGQHAATEVNIAAMPIGQPPAGFDVERTGEGEPGQWVVVADATAAGGRSFDGKQLYMATDKTFTDAGRVALWTKADSVTYFDRIAIIKLP